MDIIVPENSVCRERKRRHGNRHRTVEGPTAHHGGCPGPWEFWADWVLIAVPWGGCGQLCCSGGRPTRAFVLVSPCGCPLLQCRLPSFNGPCSLPEMGWGHGMARAWSGHGSISDLYSVAAIYLFLLWSALCCLVFCNSRVRLESIRWSSSWVAPQHWAWVF